MDTISSFFRGRGLTRPDSRKGNSAFGLFFWGPEFGRSEPWTGGGRIDDQQVCLGRRECPLPPEEGDQWQVRATGEIFRIINGEIRRIGRAPVEDFA